jgi:hypothetical protein
MPTGLSKNNHADYETARTADAKKEFEGMTLDLDKLRKLYPDRGCRVHVVIMEDGDGPAGPQTHAGRKPKEHRIFVPPSRASASARGRKR